MSNARETLNSARFFVTEAERAIPNDTRRLERMIEAAVVFGRSVTFHLQKEFAHAEGFADWYAEQQRKMREDPLCEFFVEKRNFVLKQGPIPIRKTITVSISESVAASASFRARVIRGRPWYRRRPGILIQDLLRPIREVWSEFIARQGRRRRRRALADASRSKVRESLHFDDLGWKNRPAIDLMNDYLDKLEPIVDEAEEKFA